MSSIEKVIFKILNSEGLNFTQEKTFKDFRHGLYRFDFYIPSKKIAIETNGVQHYKFTKPFHKKRSDFTKGQERDRRKIAYCLAKSIKLYCIPYWEIDNIKTFKDICNRKFLATTQYHNDIVWREKQKENP